MKICNNCQQVNPAEAMFCKKCASPLGQAQQQQQYGNPQQQNPFVNQQQWNQPNYGNQGMQNFGQPVSGGTSGRATAAAILAGVGLICCAPAGIVAAVLGWLEIQAIREGKSSSAGMTMAQIGLWGGIIGFVINVVINVIFLLFSAMAR
ncbi:MAG: DUF4190 domain-containing protein [Pyrinomonadaceae bacterium]|nr:DUF4190 domain-containing protein [Pyrinomonadaceae bacterium]